jgi:ParB family chromosome partitioning protein
MSKKSFAEKIKEDFQPTPVAEEKKVPSKARTKAVPGARLIPLSDISLDSNQPRKKLDEEKLEELAASIRNKGVIEPVTVRLIDNGYMVVTGERRYRAAQLAGLEEIPCIIKHLSDEEVLVYQLIENLQREDLSPIDEATALKKLAETGLNQTDIAQKIGKSQPYISKLLKILELPKSILEEAQKLEVSKEHMLQLLKSKNPEQLWEQIKSGATAQEVKEKVKKEKSSKGRPKIKPWTWKPEDKSFTVSIKFRSQDYDKNEVIQTLQQLINKLREER